MNSVHDGLALVREVAALERAMQAAPDSSRIRAALDSAWSFASLSCDNDEMFRLLRERIMTAAARNACLTCGGVGEIADWQEHAGAYEREPITHRCPDCCARCNGTGIFERLVDVYQPEFDEHDNLVAENHRTASMTVYCWCRFGKARREDDERRSL